MNKGKFSDSLSWSDQVTGFKSYLSDRKNDVRVSALTLCSYLNCSERRLRHIRKEAEKQGFPVGYSYDRDNGGYFELRTPQEMKEVDERLKRVIRSYCVRRARLMKNMGNLTGQIAINRIMLSVEHGLEQDLEIEENFYE